MVLSWATARGGVLPVVSSMRRWRLCRLPLAAVGAVNIVTVCAAMIYVGLAAAHLGPLVVATAHLCMARQFVSGKAGPNTLCERQVTVCEQPDETGPTVWHKCHRTFSSSLRACVAWAVAGGCKLTSGKRRCKYESHLKQAEPRS